MISSKTYFLSLINKIFDKCIYLSISIIFIKISISDYAILILFLLSCSYMYEIYSLSIPKAFNIFYYKINKELFLSIVSLTLYIIFFIFIIFLIGLILGKNYFNLSNMFFNLLFIFSICIGGLSIAIDDVIDKYSFLELKHNNLYKFDLLRIVVISFGLGLYLYLTKNFNVYFFLFTYSIVLILFSIFKYILFRGHLNCSFSSNLKNFKKIKLNGMYKVVFSVFLISILILLQFTIARILIVNFEGLGSFANYALHYQINEIFSLFFLSVIQIIAPIIIISVKKNKKEKFLLLKEKILILYLLFPPIIFGMINFLGERIIKILSPEIIYNSTLLFIFSLNLYSISLFMTIYQYLIIKKQESFFIKTLLSGLIVNIIFSILLIKNFSIIGVAISNFVSNIFIFIILNTKVSFFYFRKQTLIFFIFFLIRFMIIFIILKLFPISEFLSPLINLINNFVYYCFLFFLSEFFMPKKYRAFKNIIDV